MQKRLVIGIVAIAVATASAAAFTLTRSGSDPAGYRTATVTRGDVSRTVTSTGSTSPVGRVEVGTQISGTVAQVLVDYNEPVQQGQLLAELDKLLLQSSVAEAEASLAQAEAGLEQEEVSLTRAQRLHDGGLTHDEDLLAAEVSVKVARAQVASAEATLQKAETNLTHASIRSPIAGTVISRDVEAGQTVAASLSTPTLFVVAADLADMEIHALVDESDIGSVEAGQAVRFTVQTYPDLTFDGEVETIHLEPSTESNVVTYTVVVRARNDDGLLLPGMTATLDFILDERTDVLRVPRSALTFVPDPSALGEERPGTPAGDRRGPPALADDEAILWTLDADGGLEPVRVVLGIEDSRYAEVVSGLDAGQTVVIGTGTATVASAASTSSGGSGRRPGPPRIF